MWVATNWHDSHSDLSKYFIEKLKQVVDYKEIISNQHYTTNGFVLISEIVDVEKLVKANPRYVNRLVSLVKEAKSSRLNSSIVNDYIIQTYHPDILRFFHEANIDRIKKEDYRNGFFLQVKTFKIRLESNYLSNIKFELNSINFSSPEFKRESERIDKVIDSLVPFLIYKGYSPTSISDIAYRHITKDDGANSAVRIVNNFSFRSNNYRFLIKVRHNDSAYASLRGFLQEKGISFAFVDHETLRRENLNDDIHLEEDDRLLEIISSTIDPHNFLRSLYDQSIKRFILGGSQISLQSFNDFFETAYWRFDSEGHYFQRSIIELDPININSRKNQQFSI
jgi:hypothetical protein